MISASLGRAWFSQVALEPWRQREGWRVLSLSPRLGEAAGLVQGSQGGVGCAHILSAEMLNDVGIGEDVPRQLLLLLLGLEDHAPFAEPDDVLLHQVQVHGPHELLGRQNETSTDAYP